MRIISVTEFNSMSGRFLIHFKDSCGKKGCDNIDKGGYSAAAAKAMELAICAKDGYAIFACDNVLAHIPYELRTG